MSRGLYECSSFQSCPVLATIGLIWFSGCLSSQQVARTSASCNIRYTGPSPPNVMTSSVTATSVNVSWTQPPFSFTPVGYTVALTRLTGSQPVLCTGVDDSRSMEITMSDPTAAQFMSLHEFSSYRARVTANFNAFGQSSRSSSTADFTTYSAGMTTDIILR